jgi:long-chain acyl-CoA synthetase
MTTTQTPRRLFDCLAYQLTNSPLDDMLCIKEDGQWKKYSTQHVTRLVDQLSAGLLKMGISQGDRTPEGRDKIAIISENRPEWLMVDLAVQQIGAVSVPMYPTISANELKFLFQDAAIKIAFVGDEDLYTKVSSIRAELPDLQHVFTFDTLDGVRHWTEALADAASVETQLNTLRDSIQETDLATILYTSGTTGTPKGVMLSHKNILSDVAGSIKLLNEVGISGKRALSFLPLNHAFERTAAYCYFCCGTSIYYAENMDAIGANLQEVKPAVFMTVPRLLEKVYERIMAKGRALTGLKRRLFFWALKLGEKYDLHKPLPLGYRIQLDLANRLIFNKWREALGGEVRAIITGAAACQVKLLRIFGAARIIIMEGYGLTETAPVISGNRFAESGRMFGTVGPVLDGAEVKFGEDGEILCKGPMVMMGYYKRPDLTASVMSGEWFHTGDIGTLVEGKFLKITDRKKEIFKTSGGKYVAPQPIENQMVESRWIEQIMVVGESEKFVGALIVPAFKVIKEWYEKQGKTYPGNEQAIREAEVRSLINEAIEKYNPNFNHVEQIKRFELVPNEWTLPGGELTPTMKLKRKVILEKYKHLVANIYAGS